MTNKQFGILLAEGISSVAHRWQKTKGGVKREMTRQLLDAGYAVAESTVAGWCQGFVPKEPELIEWVIRYCLRWGRVDRIWADSLLYQARHSERIALLDTLFPQENHSVKKYEHPVQLERVEDPAIALRPALAGRLVGRESLLSDLKHQLLTDEPAPFVALTGLPGVGKTTLAVELAHAYEIRERFCDGILWVNLGREPDIVKQLERWAVLLGLDAAELVRMKHTSAYIQAIHTAIGKRAMLLVIEDAWTAEDALTFKLGGPACAHLLTTRFSNIALQFAGNRVTTVPELSETDGLRLLSQYVPRVVMSEHAQVQSLVRAVGGLPLALTLMGKYLQLQSYHGQPRRLQMALNKLQQTTERLRLEYHDGPALQETGMATGVTYSLMASIDTSYRSLHAQARSALRNLSFFPAKPNAFSEEAAVAVAAVKPVVLDELIDSGLLESNGAGRYTLHQTIADYARAKWSERQNDQRAAGRMIEYYVTFVEEQQTQFSILEEEINNIVVALHIAYEQKFSAWLIRGVNALCAFLLARGKHEIARMYLQYARNAAKAVEDNDGLAVILLHLSTLAKNSGEYAQAKEYAHEGLLLARQMECTGVASALLNVLGAIALRQGTYSLAEDYAREGLALAQQDQDRNSEHLCDLLNLLGTLATKRGEYLQAEQFLQEGISVSLRKGQDRQTCAFLISLGTLAGLRGENEAAEHNYQQGLILARSIGHNEYICSILQGLGVLAGRRGDNQLVQRYSEEGLARARASGFRERMLTLLANLSMVAIQQGAYEVADEYLQEGLSLARAMEEKEHLCSLLNKLGILATKKEDFDLADLYFQEGVELARSIGNRERLCVLLSGLVDVTTEQGRLEEADAHIREASTLAQHMGSRWFICIFSCHRGYLHLKEHHFHQAQEAFLEALAVAREINAAEVVAGALFGLGQATAALGDTIEAVHIGQESLRLYETLNLHMTTKVKQWLNNLILSVSG